MHRVKFVAVMFAASAISGCGGSDSQEQATITVLSSRPDMVSGGSALVRVSLPAGSAAQALKVSANGRDVSAALRQAGTGAATWTGVVGGLTDGANELAVSGEGIATSTLKITNYPITGPILSGPQDQTFLCQTAQFYPATNTAVNVQTPVAGISALGAPLDDKCSIAPRVDYIYRSTAGNWKALVNTAEIPADAAQTTTTGGVTLPFVVRVDTRTVNRGIYQSAILFDPRTDAPPTPATPPKAWNKRLVTMHGFGCTGGWYIQGAAQGNVSNPGSEVTFLDFVRLGQGYAVYTNTLQHPTNNCNGLLGAETAMMSKETFVKQFGLPEFTISHGFSGGSYTSTRYTDIVPGLFDGIVIGSTFPDPATVALEGAHAHLVRQYAANNPMALTEAQVVAITGFKSYRAMVDVANRASGVDPLPSRPGSPTGYVPGTFNAVVPASLRYDPATNKAGLRSGWDGERNTLGRDPASGFARRPFDNIGVQYGLRALSAGQITVDQFLDLNEKLGGFDNDMNPTSARSSGDVLAIRRFKQSGAFLGGSGGLASIPILNVGITVEDAGYHYSVFQFATRERLREANGNADNFVMWRGNAPYDKAFDTMAEWIMAYQKDPSAGSQRERVLRNKPAAAADGCFDISGKFIQEAQTLSPKPDSQCNTLFPSWEATRIVAGSPVSLGILKCELKQPLKADYAVPMTDVQFARLRQVFPTGVCDWGKSGIGSVPISPLSSAGPSPLNALPAN